MATKKQHKTKKKWFVVKAPEVFNSRELGEITAYEPKELIGRTIELSYRQLGGDARDQSQKLVMEIDKVQGETATTQVRRMFILSSFIQRVSRKAKERVFLSKLYETKDKQKIRVKFYVLVQRRLQRTVKTALSAKADQLVADYIKDRDADIMFTSPAIKTLSISIKKELKTIYPGQFIIWKIEKQ